MNLYEFYCDGDKFYDPRIQELPTQDAELSLALNDAGELTFTIPRTHPKADIFKPLTSTIEIYRDGEWMWEGRIVDSYGSFNGSTTYTLEGCLAYLNDSIQPQFEYHGNPTGYIERILNVHNSQVAENRKVYLGAVTVTDPNDEIYCYTNYNPTLQELKEDIIDDLGGYVRFRKVDGKLYMDILEEYDRTCSQFIEIGKNLIDLAPTFDYKDIASVIIPLGATLEDQEEHEEGLEALDKYVEIGEINDGKNYIARDDLVDSYNKIWKVVRFDNVHLPENLLRKAKEYLTDGQWGEMVIEAKAFDLNYTSEEFQEFRLGDKVRVKSEIHGLDRYFPITAQTIVFDNVSANTITLGGTGTPVTITGVTNQVTVNTEKLDERIKDPNRLIQQAIYQATELINQGLNGYVRVNGNEILIMDTDDPKTAKNVWRWNMGGLGYSSNGYNGPFETAITMDGTIAGKFLAANSVVAEKIDVNYKSHVEELISSAESNANGYTDDKLGDYWTSKETETYFRTEADKITAGVNTTLKGYVTTQQLSSELSITESNITTTVTNNFNKTLDDYSTTKEMNSAIQQSANSITSSVNSTITNKLKDYSTTTEVKSLIDQESDSITSSVTSTFNTKLKDYSTTTQVQSMIKQSADSITTTLSKYATNSDLQTLEQKVTVDGIFTTINNGLAGTKNFKTTKFTMDKDGITVQGGGLTIKNNDGDSVLFADTNGDLTLLGEIQVLYSSGNVFAALNRSGLNFWPDQYLESQAAGLSLSGNSSLYIFSHNNIEMTCQGAHIYMSSGLIRLGQQEGYSGTTALEFGIIDSITISKKETSTSRAVTYYGYTGTIDNAKFVDGLCVGYI